MRPRRKRLSPEELERRRAALERTGGCVYAAAREIGICYNALLTTSICYGIPRRHGVGRRRVVEVREVERRQEKRCRRCRDWKAPTDFHRNINCLLGVSNTCRACTRERGRLRRQAKKARLAPIPEP